MTLNKEQQIAAEIIDGPLLILAGAGTGKTTTLMHRIKNMVKKGVHPGNILAVTFTNKAANEMRERISQHLSFGESRLLNLGTFHSICYKILKEEYTNPNTGSHEFTLISPFNANQIVKGFIGAKSRVKGSTIASYISTLKNELVSAEDFLKQNLSKKHIDWVTVDEKISGIPDEHLPLVRKVYPLYEEHLKKNDLLDLDDLLFETAKLFLENKPVLEKYQNIFKFIMIDEYQDTNNSQYQIVKALASKYENIGVVGDDYQSIYGFRGGDIRNILNFEKDYPKAKIVKLVQNYRSQEHIISAANAVIANNKKQMHKKLIANAPKGKPIHVVTCDTAKDTAVHIGQEILDQVRAGQFNFSDYAILYRNNAMSADIELVFHQMKVPFIKLSGLDFFEHEEIQDILKYLELIHNTNNIESFSRIIMKPRRRIAQQTIKKIVLDHFTDDLLEVLDDLSKVDRVQRLAILEGKKFADLIRKYQELAKTKSVALIIEELLEEIEYVDKVLTNYEPEKQDEKKQNISKMIELIRSDETEQGRIILLDEYIENITMYNKREESDADAVKLMTLHGSKGLEFEVVHLLSFNDEQFPSLRSRFGAFVDPQVMLKELEEERRLCYVGLTRAKQELSIHNQNYYTKKDGGRSSLSPSRFISEINEKDLVFIR